MPSNTSLQRYLTPVLLLGLLVISNCAPERPQQTSAPQSTEEPAATDPTLRTIESGRLSGLIQENGSLAWRNIPYARPPVGDLRWKLPQGVENWDGVYEAVNTIQPCPQFVSGLSAGIPDTDGDGIVGNEDCLYLSVYAPSDIPEDEALPVMYWIFGGGNNSGYAGDYNGGILAESQDVIVVTVNYRLGSLGWFLHPAILEDNASGAAASGNWSTVDTIAGLEWIQDNITAFGGDPDNVTIFGESAGGGNVMSLVTSPMAEGLFHRAIVQSGGIGTTSIEAGINYTDDTVPGHAHSSKEIVNMLLIRDGLAANRDAAKVLQDSMTNDEIRELLYSQSASEFLKLYNPNAARNYPAPKKFTDGTVFVEQDPLEQLASGNYNQVPIILGTNRDERRIYLYGAWADTIRSDPEEYIRFAHYPSLQWKWRGVDNLARRMTDAQQAPVYAFRFDWDEQQTREDGFDMGIAIGAAHSTEMAFVFGVWGVGFINPDMLYDPSTNAGRDALSDAMMSYWSNFAYSGEPGQVRSNNLPEWQAWQNGDGNPKMIILDSEADGGIRMSTEEVTQESIKASFMAESWSDPQNRCRAYLSTFAGTAAFDQTEYEGLIEGGCSRE
ncbi:carboxylesterase/lipase family protein [Pseudohongiella nitratireducens]|uniref:carboxylesterase/lipase family protein n=1 Tax=Pseudohongiella nitratireducens TaxID=1768907 RepID=UPI0030EE1B48